MADARAALAGIRSNLLLVLALSLNMENNKCCPRRSLKHGLGPQFGTLLFGGMVLTIVDLIRAVFRSAQHSARNRNLLAGLFCMVTSCIANLLLSLVEYLTKFATIWAAIKGDSFLDSGRKVSDLLKRNMLDSLRIWWFPQVSCLGAAAIGERKVVACLLAHLVIAASGLFWGGGSWGQGGCALVAQTTADMLKRLQHRSSGRAPGLGCGCLTSRSCVCLGSAQLLSPGCALPCLTSLPSFF